MPRNMFRRVHGRYAQYLNVRRHRTGHLWQNRYYSCPVSEGRLWVAIRYVEENAVRALLVNSAEEYKWSSAGVHAGGAREKAPVLDGEFWEAAGGADAWRRLHVRPDRVQEVRLLRRCTYAGRPFGEEEFVREMEERFHRRWRRCGFELSPGREEGERTERSVLFAEIVKCSCQADRLNRQDRAANDGGTSW